jgi:hypothetical protein
MPGLLKLTHIQENFNNAGNQSGLAAERRLNHEKNYH